jgi:transcription initiation factor TFIID TATA-box-binding protein
MTQEDVRQLLSKLDGQATVEEISTCAKTTYPNRSLHTYVGQLLRRLEKKDFVTNVGNKTWELTEKGKSTTIEGVNISEVDMEVNQSVLTEYRLEVVNLVGTIETKCEFDLNILFNALPEAEYHPESSPFLIYRPTEIATLLVPSNGLISIVGAKNPKQIKRAVRLFFKKVSSLDLDIKASPEDILIQNVVVKGGLELELDLDTLCIGLGLERCEYDPDTLPGIVFRGDHDATVLIFRTGKFIVTGSKSYMNAVQVTEELYNDLRSLGITVD